jgi:nucleotide-binding universal stress UspA family protein
MYSHILIPTDGTELAERGVDHGLRLAQALGARVTVLSVVVPASGLAREALVQGEAFEVYERKTEEVMARLEASVASKAAAIGTEARFLQVTDAEPAEAIVRAAETHGCDLIVMASHGREGLERILIGSQTGRVLAHSTVPVLVVR